MEALITENRKRIDFTALKALILFHYFLVNKQLTILTSLDRTYFIIWLGHTNSLNTN